MSRRVYLDWNASAPLRAEARAAMLAAIDAVGNPSSVHAEGRAARAIVEGARAQVAALIGCDAAELVFTSGATEANNLALDFTSVVYYAPTDHPSVVEPAEASAGIDEALIMRHDGLVDLTQDGLTYPPPKGGYDGPRGRNVIAVAAANGETGVVEDAGEVFRLGAARLLEGHCDVTQAVGRIAIRFRDTGASTAAMSAHKIGGPKGVGALVLRGTRAPGGYGLGPVIRGGGQESGLRSGTENVVGIAGFGAAAGAALRELEDGAWNRVAGLRDALEERLETAAPDLILVGKGAPRLPNTSCFAVPGWAGETQVIQMDLAGFAVSAGSACSSGKVAKASPVLRAMGFDGITASSAIRVSIGPTTTETEVMAFADAWIDRYRRRSSRAA